MRFRYRFGSTVLRVGVEYVAVQPFGPGGGRLRSGFAVLAFVVATGVVSLGAPVAAPGDVTTTVTLSGKAANGSFYSPAQHARVPDI